MRTILALLVFLYLSEFAIAQQPYYEWIAKGSGFINGNSTLALDSEGSSFITGGFTGPTDFDPGPGTNIFSTGTDYHIYISKYDSAGNYLWTLTYGNPGGGIAYSLYLDEFDNLYCIGILDDTIDFNPSGSNGLVAIPGNGAFILKIDNDGNFIWVKSIPVPSGTYLNLNSIASKSGDVYIGGNFMGTVDFDPGPGTFTYSSQSSSNDAFVLKLDTLGNFIWVKKWGNSGDEYCTYIAIDKNHNVYCSGSFEGTVDFNPNAGSFNLTVNSAFYDGYVLKLNRNGVFKWAKQYHCNNICQSGPIDVRGNNVFVTGFFKNYIDFNSANPSLHFTAPTTNYILVKMDTSGNINLGKQIPVGSNAVFLKDLLIDSLDNIYLSGAFGDSINLDLGNSNFTLNNTFTLPYNTSSFIAKYSSLGNFTWGLGQFGRTATMGTGIDLDKYGNLHVLVNFQDTIVQLNDFSGTFYITSSSSSFDPCFIAKIGECNPISSNISVAQCDSYTSPSQNYTWTASGNYTDVIPSVSGCDSTIQINLTILQESYSSLDTTSCEPYISPSGQFIETSGTYYDTIPNSSNCDSIIQINYLLNNSYSTLKINTCGSYTSPGGQVLTASGIYYDTIPNPPNCDSIIEIDLTQNGVNDSVAVSGTILISMANFAAYQWLDCDNNMVGIPGATGQLFFPSANGSYAVEIEANGCIDTSACVAITTIGIAESTRSDITIYPNPAQDNLIISGLTEKNSLLEIFDITGKILFSQINSNYLIDLSSIENGIYLLHIKNNSSEFWKKFEVIR